MIDGLQCGIYTRAELLELRAAGVEAVTVTVSFWEDALETMDAIAEWHRLLQENADLALLARSDDDVATAIDTNRTAIILGTQNSAPLDDRLGFVELFRDLGVRVLQLTYNTQNAIGSGCYEPVDGGLSRFGVEVVEEMNRVGMMIDLSHVGERTSLDALAASGRPVLINHANPAEEFSHPRNVSSEVLRALAANGGVLGLTAYENIAGEHGATPEAFVRLIARTADRIGIEHVAVGTDLSPGVGERELEWMRRGRWSRRPQPGAALRPVPPSFLASAADLALLERELFSSGEFTPAEAELVARGNWRRAYAEGFAPR